MKELLVVAIAFWVAYQLPKWARKIVPDGIDRWNLPNSVKLVLQLTLAYIFARMGWGTLSGSLESALKSLEGVADATQVKNLVAIPEVVLASFAIVGTLWLLKVVFESLNDCKTLTESLIAIGILIVFFSFNNFIWNTLKDYLIFNLEGAEKLSSTRPFGIIESFFQQ